MKEKKKDSRWVKTRGLLNTIHLWLGVGSGLILFVVCLSGTVYTFSTEIQKVVDSDRYTVDIPDEGRVLPLDTLATRLIAGKSGAVLQSIIIPEAENGSYQFVIGQSEGGAGVGKKIEAKAAEKKGPARPRGTTYFINPYTGNVVGSGETTSSEFFMFMFRLHRWLLLDTEVGRPIVGVATLIFVVIIITGIVIWFPKKIRNWRQGLKIKTDGNWKRINHDLHNSFGIYSSLLLLVMALTGLTWSFEWYKSGFTDLFGATPGAKAPLQSALPDVFKKPAMEVYLREANNVLTYPGDCRISLTADSAGVITVSKTKNTFFATSVADRVTLDQYTGQVLQTEIFAQKPLNQKILASIKALHIGSFYGTFSKIIYFIACLIATSLPVTGVMIWINKLRKKEKKRSGKVFQTTSVSR